MREPRWVHDPVLVAKRPGSPVPPMQHGEQTHAATRARSHSDDNVAATGGIGPAGCRSTRFPNRSYWVTGRLLSHGGAGLERVIARTLHRDRLDGGNVELHLLIEVRHSRRAGC